VNRAARLVAVLGISLAGWSQAEVAGCVSVPGGAELTIEELGRVIFVELTTDRAQDLVTFGGGVCLELGDVEVRVEAETMIVRAPGPHATVEARGAVIHAAGWRLGADRLELDRSAARLRGVTLEGAGVVGLAGELELDIERGGMIAHALEVLTPSVRLVAAVGAFGEDGVVVVEDVVASTCDCPPAEAPIRVEGRVARLGLDEVVLVVEGGVMVIEGLRLGLPPVLRVTEASLAAIRVPFSIGVVTEGDRGWVLGLLERRDGDVAASADVAFGANADPRWSAALAASGDGSRVDVEARDGGLAIAATHRVALAPGWDVVLAHRHEGGLAEGRLQDGSATLEWRRAWEADATRTWTVEARGALGAAASAQRSGGVDVALARGRVALSALATSPPAPAGRVSLRLEAGGTRYSSGAHGQAWIGVAPRWRWSDGPISLDLQHSWRGVGGTSPFDERIDRVDPVSLSQATVALTGGDAWRVTSSLETRYDWRPERSRPSGRVGLARLRVTAGLTTPSLGALGLAFDTRVTVEAAGVVDPRTDRDAFVRAAFGLSTPGRAVEASVAAEAGIGAHRPGMRSLTLAGAAPLTFADGDVTVQPYLALDVWPWLGGTGSVRVVGHGIAVSWDTCCGTLDVAYRALPDGSVTTRLGFAVELREPDLADLR
jgi:hypothetical protein